MDARTRELVEWDHRYLWHPFTQMREWLDEDAIVIERGEGNYLVDTEGHRYLDGVSSLWCNVHGHRHPELDRALHEQIDRIAHSTMLGLTNIPATVLARRLVEITPEPLTRVFYSDSGATAVEVALKLALQYWQLRGEPRRTRFAGLVGGYHGDTLGAVGVGFSETFHRFFAPAVHRAYQIRPPHVFRWREGHDPDTALDLALDEAERTLEEHGRELAALVVEPLVQGAAGMWTQPRSYLPRLRELADRHGTLLIFDEVATGFGRTGRMFAMDHEDVTPDLLCLGKGLTGGYLPLAATLVSEEIFTAFLAAYAELHAFFHGHTYTGNPLGCAVALANLEVFAKEGVIERVQSSSRRFAERLAELEALPPVGDVRFWGLMAGVELVQPGTAREPYPPGARMGHRVCMEMRRRGIFVRPLGDTIVVMPPLSIRDDEIDHLCRSAAESITTIIGP